MEPAVRSEMDLNEYVWKALHECDARAGVWFATGVCQSAVNAIAYTPIVGIEITNTINNATPVIVIYIANRGPFINQ